MTYLNQAEIATNFSMITRVAQCATQEGVPNADEWTRTHSREWAAAPGWDDAWASAQASHEDDTELYDPGADEAVITDEMILGQVQAMQAGAVVTDYPHFRLPFQSAPAAGGGLAALEVEQESIDEIGGCVEAILRTVTGQRTTLPDFGRPELEFNTQPELVRAQLAQALLEFEPRVESLIDAAPSDDDPEVQIIRALIAPANDEEGNL